MENLKKITSKNLKPLNKTELKNVLGGCENTPQPTLQGLIGQVATTACRNGVLVAGLCI